MIALFDDYSYKNASLLNKHVYLCHFIYRCSDVHVININIFNIHDHKINDMHVKGCATSKYAGP